MSRRKPLEKKSFITRLLAGAIYVAAITVAIFLGPFATTILFMAIAGITSFEFYRMMVHDGKSPNRRVGVTSAVLFPLVVYLNPYYMNIVTLGLMVALVIWYVFNPRARLTDVALTFFGSLYTGLMLSAMVMIRNSDPGLAGAVLTLGIMISVWANDSFAYIFGSMFGRHKLATRISPKKSWEGFIAGVIGSIVIWLVMSAIPLLELDWRLALVAGLLCGIVGVIGDLAESRIKRDIGVKDSGDIMPGHGGLLDRTDSLLFVSITTYFILMAGQYL